MVGANSLISRQLLGWICRSMVTHEDRAHVRACEGFRTPASSLAQPLSLAGIRNPSQLACDRCAWRAGQSPAGCRSDRTPDQLPAVARHGHRKMVALPSGERSRVLLQDEQHVQTSPSLWLSERSSRGGGLNASALGRDARHLWEKCPTRLWPVTLALHDVQQGRRESGGRSRSPLHSRPADPPSSPWRASRRTPPSCRWEVPIAWPLRALMLLRSA